MTDPDSLTERLARVDDTYARLARIFGVTEKGDEHE